MGTLVKQIRKRAGKFAKALEIVEKQFEDLKETSGVALPQPFDLSKTVEQDIQNTADQKRKDRNKRKAIRRKRRNK